MKNKFKIKYTKELEIKINKYKGEVVVSIIASYILSIILLFNGFNIEISFPNLPFIRILLSFLTYLTLGAFLYKICFYKLLYKIIISFGTYNDFKKIKKIIWVILIFFLYFISNYLIKLTEFIFNFIINISIFSFIFISIAIILAIFFIHIKKLKLNSTNQKKLI